MMFCTRIKILKEAVVVVVELRWIDGTELKPLLQQINFHLHLLPLLSRSP